MSRYLWILGLLCANSLYAAVTCQTTENCPIGQECSCTVMPNSAYNRYFYVDFTGLAAQQNYICKFSGDHYSIDFSGSTFPQDATYQCTSPDCPKFPVEFTVNTNDMSQAGDMTIRYFVPASDITFPIVFQCMKQ